MINVRHLLAALATLSLPVWAADVAMTVNDDWGSGYVATIKIDNTTGTEAVTDWKLSFTFANKIDDMWNASFVQTGSAVTVDNAGWNGSVPIGSSVEFGFQGKPGNITNVPVITLINGGSNPSPSPSPSAEPSTAPSAMPSAEPSAQPSAEPSAAPSSIPSPTPSASPSTPPTAGVVACGVDPSTIPSNDDWLSTRGNQIIDSAGNTVWLTGANWFGYNTSERVFHGLWSANLEEFVEAIAARGVNIIRVPIGTEILKEWMNGVYEPTNVNTYANPNLEGKNSLEIFDHFLKVSKACGVKVLVDVHHPDQNNSGHHFWGWAKGTITEEDFHSTWEWFATRYKNDDTIVAYDLENEPHGIPNGSLGNDMEPAPGETWEAFCQRKPASEKSDFAKWDASTDANNWRYVAQTAASRILAINPKVLILVEGIEAHAKYGKWSNNKGGPFPHQCYDFNWWGGNLRGVAEMEVEVPGHQDQIMYSPHDYGPAVYKQKWFYPGFTRDTLRADVWEPNWLYIHNTGISPLLIGEWGGFMDGGDNQKWLEAIRDEIVELQLHHTFWGLNPNSGDTGGLVENDWKTWDPVRYNLLKPALWKTAGGKFIGLDHKAKIGGTQGTGISLSDHYGK